MPKQQQTFKGVKGTQFMDTGYVYAPYLPLIQTVDIILLPNYYTKCCNVVSKELVPKKKFEICSKCGKKSRIETYEQRQKRIYKEKGLTNSDTETIVNI